MDGMFGDEQVPEASNVVPAAAASGFGDFEDANAFTAAEVAAPVPAVVEAVAPAASGPIEDAFFTAYSPRAPEAPAAPVSSEPDPRVAWRVKNAEALKKRDDEEAKAKKAVSEAAKAHIKKFTTERTTTVSKKKAENRAQQKASPEAGVPAKGTTWEKVAALINFSATGAVKSRDRFKEVLGTCKPRNVAVAVAVK